MQREIHENVICAPVLAGNLARVEVADPQYRLGPQARQHQPTDGSRDGCAKPSMRASYAGVGTPALPRHLSGRPALACNPLLLRCIQPSSPLDAWMSPMRTGHLAPVLLALCASPAAAWDVNCKFTAERQASIDTAGAEHVEIVARGGDLDVRPAPGARLLARGKACASREEYLAETQVHARRKGNVVQVFVQVPAGLPVEVTDTSGDTTITKVRVTRITDSSGDLLARDLPADVEINDSSGDIRIENAAGLVKVTDSSGDIVVLGARDVLIPSDSSGDIEIERVSGSVRIENDSSGDIVITTVERNVEVLADSSGTVRISGVTGTVRVPR